jgi:hypothetical protein
LSTNEAGDVVCASESSSWLKTDNPQVRSFFQHACAEFDKFIEVKIECGEMIVGVELSNYV